MQTATENRHSWKAPKRERFMLGRVVTPTGKVLIEGVPTVGKLATQEDKLSKIFNYSLFA